MDKIVVDRQVADALVPECLDAPAAWVLALVARAKGKDVRNLVVFVLSWPRHHDLIAEIRSAGARTMLRTDGDVVAALMAASPHTNVDLLMGIGGVPEGVLAACATRAMGGGMLGRLAPQTAQEEKLSWPPAWIPDKPSHAANWYPASRSFLQLRALPTVPSYRAFTTTAMRPSQNP